MVSLWQQAQQINDVDVADLEVRKLLPQHADRRQSLLGGNVAGRSHYDLRLDTLVATRRLPPANALRAVGDGGIHAQVLQVLLFIADDYVDVVLAPQAVVGNRQQRVDVRRQVNSHDFGALVKNHVQEAGVLMRKTIVVLPPHRGRNQDVQGRYFGSPGQVIADGEPL